MHGGTGQQKRLTIKLVMARQLSATRPPIGPRPQASVSHLDAQTRVGWLGDLKPPMTVDVMTNFNTLPRALPGTWQQNPSSLKLVMAGRSSAVATDPGDPSINHAAS